jgi:hypothetical protein
MPLEQLARRLVVGLSGPWPTVDECAWLEHWRPAGVILFARNLSGPGRTELLGRALHDLVPGLEIVVDHEGGPVSAAAAAAGRPPAAWGLGMLDDADLTRRVHVATGERLAALGVDRVLAPVADVLTEPRNPVIGVRAFGCDPNRVSRHVAAAVAGLREGGVGVCLKHWPGHGGTATDSHLEPSARDDVPASAPFVAGLAAGADAIMVGHLHRADGPPATLDPATVQAARVLAGGAVRRIYADDVTMGALREPLAARGVPVPPGAGLVPPGDLPAAWLVALADAGCDRLLVRGIPGRAFPVSWSGGTSALSPVREAEGRGLATDPPPAWGEVWRRLGESLPADLAAGRPDLLWLDRTVDDRWGPADGDGAGMVPALAERFGTVRRESGGGETRLLVTSHRPLDAAAERAAGWMDGLADAGRALAVGHPALESDVAALVPSGWEVAYLPEWRL